MERSRTSGSASFVARRHTARVTAFSVVDRLRREGRWHGACVLPAAMDRNIDIGLTTDTRGIFLARVCFEDEETDMPTYLDDDGDGLTIWVATVEALDEE